MSMGVRVLLTLGMHVKQELQYLVCVSVCLCVCVSVTQHLIFHVIIRATSDTNLLSGRWLHDKSAIFYSAKNVHAHKSGPRG